MNFFQRLGLFFYVSFVAYVCFFWILLVDDRVLHYEDYGTFLEFVFSSAYLPNLIMLTAVFVMLLNLLFYCLISTSVKRDRVISFDNPNGRVSVSLFALEDLVKRTILQFEEIKDNRPSINVASKVLRVKVPIVLKSDVQIPEVTSRVQAEVLRRIRDTIGGSQKIDISVYVSKINLKRAQRVNKSVPKKPSQPPVQKAEPEKKSGNTDSIDDTPDGPVVPFQGYKP